MYWPLRASKKVPRKILYRLVRGLNRVFTGLLINADRTLYLATANDNSQSKVSRLLEDTISVDPKKGERVSVEYDESRKRVRLNVFIGTDTPVGLTLHPIRYEFLSRVAEGALPSTFSRECYEDLLAFKSQVLKAIQARRIKDRAGFDTSGQVTLTLLEVDAFGVPRERHIEVEI